MQVLGAKGNRILVLFILNLSIFGERSVIRSDELVVDTESDVVGYVMLVEPRICLASKVVGGKVR